MNDKCFLCRCDDAPHRYHIGRGHMIFICNDCEGDLLAEKYIEPEDKACHLLDHESSSQHGSFAGR